MLMNINDNYELILSSDDFKKMVDLYMGDEAEHILAKLLLLLMKLYVLLAIKQIAIYRLMKQVLKAMQLPLLIFRKSLQTFLKFLIARE